MPMSDLILAVAQSIAQPGNLAQNIQDHLRLAQCAAAQGAQIVVFPELSLTGYDRGLTPADALTPADTRLRPLQALADKHNMLIIVGAPILSPAGLHIGALNFLPGVGVKTYQKQYLHEGEEIAFAAGHGGDPLQMGGQTVCMAICAEITHAQHARAAADCGAAIYAASCFITPQGYTHDAGLLQGYARAHGMAVLLANYGAATGGWAAAGRSAIWSDKGTLLACASDAGEAVVVARFCKG
jgi:predicted amidohydrolase